MIQKALQDKLVHGKQKVHTLGNLNAKHDWGYAPEYCLPREIVLYFISCGEGMWRMLQLDKAEDFVLATGETHTVREFTEVAFDELGIELEWQGENENEKGIVKSIQKEKLQIIKEACHSELVFESKNKPVILSGVEESLNNVKVGDVLVSVDPSYYRPTEVDLLIGDPTKAKACPPSFWWETFGWEARPIKRRVNKNKV